jgi:hypothetical protein
VDTAPRETPIASGQTDAASRTIVPILEGYRQEAELARRDLIAEALQSAEPLEPQ